MHEAVFRVEPQCGSWQCQDSPGLWLHGQQPSHPTGQAAGLPMQRRRAAPAFHPLLSVCKAHPSAGEGACGHCQLPGICCRARSAERKIQCDSCPVICSHILLPRSAMASLMVTGGLSPSESPVVWLRPTRGRHSMLILMALFNSPKEGLPPTLRTHTTQNHLSLNLLVFLDHSLPLAEECVSPFREASLGAKCSSVFDSHRTGQES